MALTHEDVKKIASLARLRFSPEEEVILTAQLAGIVAYIDRLASYEGTPESESAPALREMPDEPRECLPREKFLANAPASLDAFLLVPEVKGGGDGDA
jgi:aspartyl-tRNA(Asn)/glutamyl-tRNA(Gln) amidotransferase subunit C